MWFTVHSRLWKTLCYCLELCGNWTHTFLILSLWILLGVRNVLGDICREQFYVPVTFFPPRIVPLWDDVEKMHCCISTSKVVKRTQPIVMFYVFSLLVYFCVLFIWSDLWSWSKILTFLLYVLFFMFYSSWFIQQKFNISFLRFIFIEWFVRFIKQSCLLRVVSCSLFLSDASSIHKAKIEHF